jgi:hypothetical protein
MSTRVRVLPFPSRKPAQAEAPNPALARAEVQLAEAAHLVETVAYDLAGKISTDRVVRLMLLAADIERMAHALGRAAPVRPTPVRPTPMPS